MNQQEQQMIQTLADRINNTPLSEKDPDAEQFLQQNLGGNPDALYILAQTTLVQQYALEQAQKQLADARAQIEQQRQQPKHATSFLGSLLGSHEEATPPPPPYTPVPSYSQQSRTYSSGGSSFSGSAYAPPPPPQYQQPQYGQPQYGQPQYASPQSGGFLRSAMQTATGVAAGALAFEGIESLMHGFGGGGSSNFGSGLGGGRPEEIINNNYYGDGGSSEHKYLSSDIEDRRNDGSSFDNAVARDDHNYGKDDILDPDGSGSDSSDSQGDDSRSQDDLSSDDFSSSDDRSDTDSFTDGDNS